MELGEELLRNPGNSPDRPVEYLEATLSEVGDMAALAIEWRTLEKRARPSFFQSWHWLGAFAHTVGAERRPAVLRVRSGPDTVGLGLLWPRTVRRLGFVRSRTWCLHETGWPEFDGVTMEHNGLLVSEGEEAAVTAAAVRCLSRTAAWDEIVLSGLDEDASRAWQLAARGGDLSLQTRWSKPCFIVDLARIRREQGSYLDSLSANTRYQARRAMRHFAERGPLHCARAGTLEQAFEWFARLRDLHQAQWTVRGKPGAFGTDFARSFHDRLIRAAWPGGNVEILRVTAGDQEIGYLYNFVRDGVVSNYQSGHIEAADSKLKPGLTTHCLAVEDALQRGLRAYDLLMGGAHFKRSLANDETPMHWHVLQRPRLSLRLEAWLRRIHSHLQERRAMIGRSDG